MLSKLIHFVRETKSPALSNNGLVKRIKDSGIELSRQGLDNWLKDPPHVVRNFQILVYIRAVSGKSWAEFGKVLDSLFKVKN